MAQRYGGRFSPEAGVTPGRRMARKPRRYGARVNLLYLAPAPLLLTALSGGALTMAGSVGALALIWGGAFLTRHGLNAEDAYNAARVARRPAIPRKLFGAIAIGSGVALAAASLTGGLAAPLIFGALASALHLGAFGLDPMQSKGFEDHDPNTYDRAERAIAQGDAYLKDMLQMIPQAGDRHLTDRVSHFAATVREMFDRLRENPEDLPQAKRHLSVYLMAARDATDKFAAYYGRTGDNSARADYETLLGQLEQSFAQRAQTLLIEDKSDLDIEVEVLMDRLNRETVPTR